jgi:hypothetical protein
MWPKSIVIRGITIQVESWEELDEIIQRYGSDVAPQPPQPLKVDLPNYVKSGTANLAVNDRVLLQQFVANDGRGVMNRDLADALGVQGKSIGPALRRWGRRVGLAEQEGVEVFESFNRTEGRGYKLTSHFLKVAQSLLQEK